MPVSPAPAWISPFLDDLLTRWLTHAVTPSGRFFPYLDRAWQPLPDGPRTLVSQSRLIYVFLRAHERGLPGCAETAQVGLAALTRDFRAPDGGWYWACDAEGQVIDHTRNAYGHAFVLLAQATAARVLGDPGWTGQARETWAIMRRTFREPNGGLRWQVAPDGSCLDTQRGQNPLMHTFEALLALFAVDPDPDLRADTCALWHFLRDRQRTPGCLPEWYDAAWNPCDNDAHAIVDLGHAFEWAFLLSEADALGLEDGLLSAGEAFLAFAIQHGLDPATGGAWATAEYDGRPRDRHQHWWGQCEAVRALHRYATRHHDASCVEPLARLLAFVDCHFVDHEAGGWFYDPLPRDGAPRLDKGNAWKLDYHVVNMTVELLG
jgi:mannose/cellobiose epimerase-like protein (N-acyl-D-glucosamine 2-epimerase family)